MEKEKLKKLITIGIITPQQASNYLRELSHIPLKNWLIEHRYLNEQRWQQIFSTQQQLLPQSFIFSPNTPSKTVDDQTQQEITAEPTKQMNIEKERVFLHYEIQQKIGEGGMGKVYKARDSITNRIVALKFISGSIITNDDRKRFLQEVRAISRLEHENIVRLYEVGEQPTLYYAMEYIEGKTLKHKSFHNFAHAQIAAIFEQVSLGLHCAHQKGIIHRDIKPDNILLTEKHQVKITDFGLAKDNEIQSSISRTGNIVGTPAYLSPEQVQGTKIDARADIYSLGATLYYILTKQSPFRDESFVSLFFDILHTIPTAPRRFNNDISKDLQAICLKCLEKKPSLRYNDAQELATDLRNFIEKKPITAQKNNLRTVSHQLRKLAGKKWLLLLLCLNVLLFSYANENRQRFINAPRESLRQFIEGENLNHYEKLAEFCKSKPRQRSFQYLQLYNQAQLLYQKRQINRDTKQNSMSILTKYIKKITALQKSTKLLKKQDEDFDYFILYAKYKLIHIDVVRLITNNFTKKNIATRLKIKIEKLNEKLLTSGKLPRYQHMQKQLRAFEEIANVFLQRKTKNPKQNNLTFSGYGNLFLAHQEGATLNLVLKYLHKALRMIPFEEQVYLKLMEVYSKIEFYEEAICLHNHLQKINPFLIESDILLIKILMKQRKFSKLDSLFSKLEVYNKPEVLLLKCEYLFLINEDRQALVLLNKLSKKRPNNFLKRAIGKTKSQDVHASIRISTFYTLKREFDLAAEYIKQAELLFKTQEMQDKNKKSRINSRIQRLRINLYRAKLQQNQSKFSKDKFDSLFKEKNVTGGTEKFITTLNIISLFAESNINIGSHLEYLKTASNDYCFFMTYANYLFHQKKYLEAIVHWGNAMYLQPIFHNYIKQKKLHALELYEKRKLTHEK
ncbi:protein kinase [Candidatus Uabimicrobium sp. HlEnr_7]|uniref:serine/threonine-protein kinase n=1 Tax=Candidatus Uabimicrobium helgolandensis TaxID=3095367 RepID=UPI0035591B7B